MPDCSAAGLTGIEILTAQISQVTQPKQAPVLVLLDPYAMTRSSD